MLSSDIDKKILRIQESTRTSLPFFIPLHNILRMKFNWYYRWHLLRGANILHFLVLSLFTAGMFFAVYNQSIPKSMATPPNDGFVQINTEAGWNAGTKTNLNVTAAPSIRISNASTSGIPLDASMLSANVSANTVSNVLVNDGAYWNGSMNFSPDPYVQIDLGQEKQLSRFYEKYRTSFLEGYAGRHIIVSYSTNGTDFTQLLLLNSASSYFHVNQPLDYIAAEPITARYVRFAHSSPQGSPPPGMPADYVPEVDLIALYESSVATHISTATQLDSQNENASWTTFVSSASVPAYTTMKYRFRTSLDAETWSSWTASQNYVASIDIGTLLGNTDKKKRYLQVETTMANTDGSSTPVLSSYTANFTAVCPANTTENNTSQSLTSEAEWNAGTNVNTDLTNPSGSVKIGISGDGAITITNAGDATYNGLYVESGTYNGKSAYTNGNRWLWYASGNLLWAMSASEGDIDPNFAYSSPYDPLPANPWAVDFQGTSPAPILGATATHTSAATQLDGTVDINSWTTFVPAGTIPAETSIKFRFRTSADAATWGSWTTLTNYGASIDIATLLGDTDQAKRYLQVETTLANTDGSSTPTRNNYTANYNACAPNTPAPTCSDDVQNGDETGVDCGGSCGACPVPPTCSDGVQNGDETGVDCGGSCGACAIPPTCSDGIQNQDETGVDCGGSCGACTPDEPDPTCSDGTQNGDETGTDCGGSCGACPSTCPAGGESACGAQAEAAEAACYNGNESNISECISEARCAQQDCIVSCGGTGADQITGTKILVPNGGESYQLTKDMTINWVYGNGNANIYPDLSKGEKTGIVDAPIRIVLSTNGGLSYDKLLQVIYPKSMASLVNQPNNQYVGGGIKPYTSFHTYDTVSAINSGYYSYLLSIPNAESLISDTARIKLEPVVFGCGGLIEPDTSDNNFRIVAAPVTPPLPCSGPNCQPATDISMMVSPSNAVIKPLANQQYTANVVTSAGADITNSCSISWSLTSSGAGSLNQSGLFAASITQGSWPYLIRADATCGSKYTYGLASIFISLEERKLNAVTMDPWGLWFQDGLTNQTENTFIYGADQFGLALPLSNISINSLDSRIGNTSMLSAETLHIDPSKNYGCYVSKIEGQGSYNGKTMKAYNSVYIFPEADKVSQSPLSTITKIVLGPTIAKAAEDNRVLTSINTAAQTVNIRPNQTTWIYHDGRDQLWRYMPEPIMTCISHDPAAGQLTPNCNFTSSGNVGKYDKAIEIKAVFGNQTISKFMDVNITDEQSRLTTVGISAYNYGNNTFYLPPNSGHVHWIYGFDQFNDLILGPWQAVIEKTSDSVPIDVYGTTNLKTRGTTGYFPRALKVYMNIPNNMDPKQQILGPSPVLYVDLYISSDYSFDNPKACLANKPQPCPPGDTDPNCKPCENGICPPVIPPTPCTGICSIKKTFEDITNSFAKAKGSGTSSTLALVVAALLALGIALLNMAGNVAAALNGGNIFSFFIKGREKKETRGTVYDAVTGLSIPYATIIVTDIKSKQSAFAISDKNGVFSISVSPEQQYSIKVEKLNYELFKGYNSTKVKKFELKYNHNYFGGVLTVPKDTYLFDYNLPVMQTETDSTAKRVNIFNSIGKALTILNYAIIAVGLSFAFYAISLAPSLYNWIIFVLYIVLIIYLLIKYLFLSGHNYGEVLDTNGKPIELALVRAIRVKTGKLVKTIATDKNGKFGMALPVGVYHIYSNKASMQQNNEVDAIIGSAFRAARVKIEMDKYTNDTIKSDSQTEVITDQQKKAAGDMSSNSGKYVNNADEIIQEYKGQ